MTLQSVVGEGIWVPTLPSGPYATNVISNNDILLDADEEEIQFIGNVHIDGGGSKTFGTSSIIGWLAGPTITFQASATLRIGVKRASSISTTAGPPARAAIGAAAFDVYKDLIGGTDTITSSAWRNDTMASGSSFTVNDGDLIAVCLHLDVVSSAQSVKTRQAVMGPIHSPTCVLVTSGPTYTIQSFVPNIVITFDDGTLGWLTPSIAFSAIDTASGNIGNTNIKGNVFRLNYPAQLSSIGAVISNGGDCALDLYSDPLGTPAIIGTVSIDANMGASSTTRFYPRMLASPVTLMPNTDYAIGVRQTSATGLTINQRDVNAAAHFKTQGLGAECYGATSTAGAAFVADNSGNRRYSIYAELSALNGNNGNANYLIGI